MAQIQVDVAKPVVKQNEQALGDVSAIIGMMSNKGRGSMALSFEKSLSSKVLSNMLALELDGDSDEAYDMVGEITNMVCGGAKNLLSDKGYEFELSRPYTFTGTDQEIHHKADGSTIVIEFSSNFGCTFLELCFDNTP